MMTKLCLSLFLDVKNAENYMVGLFIALWCMALDQVTLDFVGCIVI